MDKSVSRHSSGGRHTRHHAPPFWQADRPYLHEQQISDARFRRLGYIMAFLAGAINAGGFFAFARYTSHVTGSMSLAADMVYTREWSVLLLALASVCCFIGGAAHSAWVIFWMRQKRFRGSFGFSMWLEAVYLLVFGLFGATLLHVDLGWDGMVMPSLALFQLCFIMGMHNTVVTVLSGGAIRSTHMTGSATDLGIELAKSVYYAKNHPRLPHVRVNRPKMLLLAGLMAAFLGGGVVGAWGYQTAGHHFALPVALVLFVLGAGSVGYDVKLRLKFILLRWYKKRKNLRKKSV
ncbi:YoaK family protein [Neisseria animalis]|uniref:DUF1275 domain-containing protein n=1 Tax=Neisseria animalis TaxID=492 RepID=A0A5P3MTZ7_NEIAN|nr:YoaK family protein [Neisseria animalis]QEY24129.1 DUF1275 domain-containing protein [Neisseria animalis]ROW31513.1 DUF1275 domain-containing protein [Neisseria animalis]VEE06348.1 Predicted membrane protein [Neisseria animalis]